MYLLRASNMKYTHTERESQMNNRNIRKDPCVLQQDEQASAKLIEAKRCKMLLPAACWVYEVFSALFYDVHSIIIVIIIIITIITGWVQFSKKVHFFHALKVWIELVSSNLATFTFRVM